ncbi:hypothetical protein MTF65_06025 [Streptomyces sp. APSN-46.1]|nr:hypothetical protein [Streptomyces sp. APSN-46.1]MCJ1676910.1 hypothetical protein [Streptomyces sp. APSN-46.1]
MSSNVPSPELRRTAIMRRLISYSLVIGHHDARLTPQQAVALIRRSIRAI